MQTTFSLALLSVAFSTQLSAQDGYGDDLLISADRPTWINDAILASILQRGTSSGLSIGGYVDQDSPPSAILTQLYSEQIDVAPSVNLRQHLSVNFPRYDREIRTSFDARTASRVDDDELFGLLSSPKNKKRAIAELRDREKARTTKLAEDLEVVFLPVERETVISFLVQKLGYWALCYPWASAELGLDSTQQTKLEGIHTEFLADYAELQEKKAAETVSSIADKQHAKAIRLLSVDQAEKYFKYAGTLTADERLSDATDRLGPKSAEAIRAIVSRDAAEGTDQNR